MPEMGRLWGVIAVIAFLFYLLGAADYVLLRLAFEPYLRLISPDQHAWIVAQPLAAQILWAVAVWSGLLGAVMMLARVEGGVIALAVAAAATVAITAFLFWIARPPLSEVAGAPAARVMVWVAGLSVLIWLVARLVKRRALRRATTLG